MKVQIPLELSKSEQRDLFDNSIERVINTAIRILASSKHEDSQMNLDDWDALKPLVCRLWNSARNQAFIEAQKERK